MNARIQNRIASFLGACFVTAIVVTLGIVGFSPTEAVSGPRWASSSGSGGVASGGPATFNSLTLSNVPTPDVLYVGPTGVVTGSANLTYVDTTKLLTVGSGTTTSAGIVSGNISSGLGGLGKTGGAFTSTAYLLYYDGSNNTLIGASGGSVQLHANTGSNSGAISITTASIAPLLDANSTLGASANRFSSAFLGTASGTGAAAATVIDVSSNGAQVFSVSGTGVASSSAVVTNTLTINKTITPIGTTGSITNNSLAGSVNIATASATATVTNASVTVNSVISVSLATNDATCAFKNYVPSNGSFIVNATTTCTGTASFRYAILSP